MFIDDVDTALSHYSHREDYATELSNSLAEMIDRNVWRMLIKAAMVKDAASESTAGLTSLVGQKYTAPVTVEENTSGKKDVTGRQLVDAIYRARTRLKMSHVAVNEAVAIIRPEQYELLVNAAQETGNMAWLNKDYQTGNDVNTGLPQNGAGLHIAGIPIHETENLPMKDESTKAKYEETDPSPLAKVDGGSDRASHYYLDSSNVLMC